MHTARRTLSSIVVGLLTLALVGCSSSSPDDTNSVTIGLLLPFTGADSATTSNFERAALYAAKRVNQGGGIGGKPLRIVSRDTHSSLAAGQRSAEWLIDAGAKAIIGPESAAIAPALYPLLTENQVALLSPLIGAGEEPEEPAFDCKTPWFRLAPSAKTMGEHLAKLIASQNVKEVAIIYANDAYNEALTSALRKLFVSRGGSVPLELKVDPDAQSYAGIVQTAVAQGVTAVVLATSARAGALLVNEFDALSAQHVQWFLSPLLKTELLVANVAPDALDGAQGVAPKLFNMDTEFSDAFAEQWQGDQPLEGAYFYYDAVALLALALQKAAVRPVDAGTGDLQALAAAIEEVAAPLGEAAGWNEVETGLAGIRNGDDCTTDPARPCIYYTGLTGPMLLAGPTCSVTGRCFATCGGRLQGDKSLFSVENGRIVNQ